MSDPSVPADALTPEPGFHEEEKHSAQVEFWNNCGQHLHSVGFLHKYVGRDMTLETTGPMDQGAFVRCKKQVLYTTGWNITHCDWWLITMVDDHGNVYISDPDNGTCWIDVIEEAFKHAVPALKKAFDELMKNKNNKVVAAAAAGKVTVILLDLMTNDMKTCGFKRCNLTDHDAGGVMQIEIKALARSTSQRTDADKLRFVPNGSECTTSIKMVKAAA